MIYTDQLIVLNTLKQREYLQDQSPSFPSSPGLLPSACLAAPAAGTSSPCQQVERSPRAGEMLSEVSDLQFEAGLQSWASLLTSLLSEIQTHTGHN